MAAIIADVPEFGGLLAVVKAVIMLAFIAPWLYFAPWASKDATRLFGSPAGWNAVVLGPGLLGVLLWLVMPFYVLGLLFYVVLAAAGLAAYVVYRNGRVDEKRKVLTKAHFTSTFSRKDKFQVEILTKVTIYDANEKVVFPPDMTKADLDEMETYNLAQELLYDIVWRRASEVALAPAGEKAPFCTPSTASPPSGRPWTSPTANAPFISSKASPAWTSRMPPAAEGLDVDRPRGGPLRHGGPLGRHD